MKTRLNSLITVFIYALFFASSLNKINEANAQAVRPNIIMIMVDDLDVPSFQAALDARLLPNIASEFVDKGVNFANSFVTFSLCCPSRVTFLTGLYPHNHGVLDVAGVSGGYAKYLQTNLQNRNLPTWFKGAGYTTGLVGKYMNGYKGSSLIPPNWDSFYGLYESKTYCTDNFGFRKKDLGSSTASTENYQATASLQPYQTDVIATKAVNFINAAPATSPFFLTVTPSAPHLEYDCPKRAQNSVRPATRHVGLSAAAGLYLNTAKPSFNEADISDKPALVKDYFNLNPLTASGITLLKKQYNDRIDSLIAVDDLVSQLVSTLRSKGLYENTIIIFTSDNGFLLGEHRARNKILPYDESIRVPLYIKMNNSTRGSVTSEMALNNDLAPTLINLAGITLSAPHFDGRSLVPVMTGTPHAIRKRCLIEDPLEGTGDSQYPFAFNGIRAIDPATNMNRIWTHYFHVAAPNDFWTESTESYNLLTDPYALKNDAWINDKLNPLFHDNMERLISCSPTPVKGKVTCQTAENY